MSLLAKTLNKSADEISELIYTKTEGTDELQLKEGADEILFGEIEQFVKRIKEGVKPKQELLDNQYKRGQKETAENIEKEFKEFFSFESELKGVELFKSYIQTLQDDKSKLTPDKIKLHPVYLDMEKKYRDIINKTDQDWREEFEKREKQYEKDKVFDQIKKGIRTHLKGLNPVLEENPVIAENRIEDFVSKFEKFDWELSETDNKHIPILEGNRVEDSVGNVMYFPTFVTNEAKKFFEFKKQDDKGSPGDNGEGTPPEVLTIPKNDAEYISISKKLSPEKKQEYRIMYETAKKEGVISN